MLNNLIPAAMLIVFSTQAGAFFCFTFGYDNHSRGSSNRFLHSMPLPLHPPLIYHIPDAQKQWRSNQPGLLVDVNSAERKPELIQGYKFRPNSRKNTAKPIPSDTESLLK